MANLNAAINSLPVEYSIEFNQAYTLNPTVTGSGSIGTGNKFTLSSGSGAPFFQSTIGPVGGAGSWYFPNNGSNDGARLRTVQATLPSTWADGDYTASFWLNVRNIPVSYFGAVGIFKLSSGASATTPEILLVKNSSTQYSIAGRFNNTTVAFTPPFTINEFHMVSIRKSISDGTIVFTADGQYQTSFNDTSTGTASFMDIGFDGLVDTSFEINISNLFVGPSTITQNDLYGVYLAGTIAPRIVKYYDGSSWQTSSNQKVWNGTSWIPWNASYRTSSGTWQQF